MREWYLDEDITVTFQLDKSIRNTDEIIHYRVEKIKEDEGGNWDYQSDLSDTKFIGEVFISAGQTSVTLHLNSLFNTYYETPQILEDIKNDVDGVIPYTSNFLQYRVGLLTANDSPLSGIIDNGQKLLVHLVNRYPTLDKRAECVSHSGGTIFGDPFDNSSTIYPNLVFQGYNNITERAVLLPRIPQGSTFATLVSSTMYQAKSSTDNKIEYAITKDNVIVQDYTKNTITKPSLNYSLKKITVNNPDPDAKYQLLAGCVDGQKVLYTIIGTKLKGYDRKEDFDLYLWSTYHLLWWMPNEEVKRKAMAINGGTPQELWSGTDYKTYVSRLSSCDERIYTSTIKVYIYNEIPVADIDICPAKYYLYWYDRFGGVQCQPFEGNVVHKNEYKTTNVENINRIRRFGSTKITSQWKLVSNWVNDDAWLIYESLFVSPFVMLYDTENGVYHNVLIKDNDYTEKSYKNQGNKLNFFECTVEKNYIQKVSY